MKKKRILCICLTLVLCLCSVAVYGSPLPDLTKDGRITVNFSYDGMPSDGGIVSFYYIAKADTEHGFVEFVTEKEFNASGFDADKIYSAEDAAKIASFVTEKDIKGTEVSAESSKAELYVPSEKLGVYLIVQTERGTEGTAIKPFMVSVPSDKSGVYTYNIKADPKMDIPDPDIPDPDNPDPDKPGPDNPGPDNPEPGKPDSGDTDNPGNPDENGNSSNKLPQTGQLKWPVPFLAGAGIILLAAGWILRLREKKNED